MYKNETGIFKKEYRKPAEHVKSGLFSVFKSTKTQAWVNGTRKS